MSAFYHFGRFQFDAQSRLLYRDNQRVTLTPKAADLLLAFLEHQGQLLGKDELLKLVWPDTFVEEGNLSKHIFFLRKVLESNGGQSDYIETIPKRGYRFGGPVLQISENDRTAVVIEEGSRERLIIEETDETAPRRSSGRGKALAVASLVLLALTVLGGYFWKSRTGAPPFRSLLVLPFANVGGQVENEYFSDGLTEDLITAFSGVQGLRVIPRTTAFQFKGKSGDLQAIGRRLSVQTVLDGGVQREGERLRIRLALTRVSDGQTIWSQSYDRTTQDVFATEDEIANIVVGTLFPKGQRSANVPSPSGTKNIEAQNLYLKGNFIRQKFFDPSLADGLALFQKAVQLDPSYAQAWAAQAFCYAEIGHGYQRYPKDVLPLAVQAAQHALQLNPRLALAHATLGYLDLEYLRDWAAAKRELEAAIRLDPNDGESHHWMSHYWISLGRFTEAEAEARRAVECDPLNFSIGSHLAFTKYEEGHFPEAIEAAAATLRLDPAHQPSSFYQIRAYEESGQLSEAIAIRRRIGWNDPPVDALETGLRRDGAAGYWRLCKEFWFRERSAGGPARPSEIAWIYAHLGDQERTLEWLDRAVEERDGWAVYMKVEPPFASLRSDPRFQKISRAAGLP